MKIAIFTDSFYPQINGVVTSLLDISKGMADKGHSIFIVAPKSDNKDDEIEYPGIRVLRVPAVDASFYTGFKWSSVLHRPTTHILKKEKIDIVHFMTPFTVSIFGILFARLQKIPLIATYHTFISELTYIKQFFPIAGVPLAGELLQRFSWKYSGSFYNRAQLITVPTENARLELISNKIRPRVEAVSNGIKLDSFDNSKAMDVKNQYNPNGPIVLYVGRIAPEKNMECLLAAYKEVCLVDSKTKFLIVGGGPSLDECIEFVKTNNLEDRILFLGLIPTSELKISGIFGASDIFVTASTTETQSITILEAEANGIPCIGPRAKGIPNVIENNVNGFLVEPNDATDIKRRILDLLNNPELYQTMSKACIESVKVHDFTRILEDWELRYQREIDLYKVRRANRRTRRTNYL